MHNTPPHVALREEKRGRALLLPQSSEHTPSPDLHSPSSDQPPWCQIRHPLTIPRPKTRPLALSGDPCAAPPPSTLLLQRRRPLRRPFVHHPAAPPLRAPYPPSLPAPPFSLIPSGLLPHHQPSPSTSPATPSTTCNPFLHSLRPLPSSPAPPPPSSPTLPFLHSLRPPPAAPSPSSLLSGLLLPTCTSIPAVDHLQRHHLPCLRPHDPPTIPLPLHHHQPPSINPPPATIAAPPPGTTLANPGDPCSPAPPLRHRAPAQPTPSPEPIHRLHPLTPSRPCLTFTAHSEPAGPIGHGKFQSAALLSPRGLH